MRIDIAAGDDFLSVMIVNWIFRHSGAFFIRRTFGSDGLYRAILTEYDRCEWRNHDDER
jgi:glyceronephosphate O-acyltransferase